MFREICLLALLLTLSLSSSVTPEHFEVHFKQLNDQYKKAQMKFFKYSLGVSEQEHQIFAYCWTAIPQINKIEDLYGITSALITSMFHPRQVNGQKMLLSLLQDLPIRVQADQQLAYLVRHSAIWVIPYVNIDSYYVWTQSLPRVREKLRKNKHAGNKHCPKQWQNGVDINRNFDYNWGTVKSSEDPCGEQYRGEKPFSTPQAAAIKKFYEQFKVTIAIDVHSYGNEWIYPFASDSTGEELKSSPLYYQYEEVNKQLTDQKYNVSSCFNSLHYVADGVYIDWALAQGALTYAFQFGTSFESYPKVLDDIQKALNGFYTVLKHNSYKYKFYRTKDTRLFIQSFSMIDFKIIIQNNNFQLVPMLIKAGEGYIIDLAFPTSQTTIIVEDSLHNQTFYLSNLQIKTQQESAKVLTRAIKSSKESAAANTKGFIYLAIILGGACIICLGYISFLYRKKQSTAVVKDKSDTYEAELFIQQLH